MLGPTSIGSRLSGLSAGLILGALDGGLRGFFVGAGGSITAFALAGLAGGGFLGKKRVL